MVANWRLKIAISCVVILVALLEHRALAADLRRHQALAAQAGANRGLVDGYQVALNHAAFLVLALPGETDIASQLVPWLVTRPARCFISGVQPASRS
jgi:hypothetical protein